MFRHSIYLVSAALIVCAPSAAVAENLNWRVNSLLAPQLFGESGRVLAGEVSRLTEGAFEIEVYDQLVLDVDAFEALQTGLVDAVWGSPGHHHREDPSLTLFGGFPFGPDPSAFTTWMNDAGGSALLNELYSRHGLRSLYCGALPAESGGWFRSPVQDVDDLEDLSMRAFGYGAQTLRNIGTTTYELPASDIRPAYDAGIIDAAEFAMPSIDAELGLDEMAPYLHLPGWQQPATSLELLVLETTWLKLPEHFRLAIMTSCEFVSSWTFDVALPRQEAALDDFATKGVDIRLLPDEVLAALEVAWSEELQAEIARYPEIGRVWAHYNTFVEAFRPESTTAGSN